MNSLKALILLSVCGFALFGCFGNSNDALGGGFYVRARNTSMFFGSPSIALYQVAEPSDKVVWPWIARSDLAAFRHGILIFDGIRNLDTNTGAAVQGVFVKFGQGPLLEISDYIASLTNGGGTREFLHYAINEEIVTFSYAEFQAGGQTWTVDITLDGLKEFYTTVLSRGEFKRLRFREFEYVAPSSLVRLELKSIVSEPTFLKK